MRFPLLLPLLVVLASALPAQEPVLAPLLPENTPEWSRPGQFEVVIEKVGPEKEKVAELVAGFVGLRLDYTRAALKRLPVTVLRNSSELRAKGSMAKLAAVGAKVKLIKQKKAGGSRHTGSSVPGAPAAGSRSATKFHPSAPGSSLSEVMKRRQQKTGPPTSR